MSQQRLFRVAAIFLVCLAVLMLRLFQLQVLEHDDWLREARRSRSSLRSVPFARGSILDADGQVLAKDLRACDLVFEYRSFRRGHLAGQLFEALTLLGRAPGGLAACWNQAEAIGKTLFALRPADLQVLPKGTKGDFLFYMPNQANFEKTSPDTLGVDRLSMSYKLRFLMLCMNEKTIVMKASKSNTAEIGL